MTVAALARRTPTARRSRRGARSAAGWLYATPTALFVLLLFIDPLLVVGKMSVSNWPLLGGDLGINAPLNYQKAVMNRFFWDSVGFTVKYTVLATANIPMSRARSAAALTDKKGSLITINEEGMYDAGVRYEDLVGASEAVVTKPGYGIISECIANDAAVLYTPRGHFPEYDVLVDEMPKYLRSASIGHDDLLAGKWESALDKLLAQPKIKKKPETNGADVAAEVLLKALDKPPKKPRGRPKVKV